MSLKIEMVVFDMAGTTVMDKNEVEDCFVEALVKTGLKATHEEINAMMGWSKKMVFETLWKSQLQGAPAGEIEIRTNESYDTFRYILENHYIQNPVIPTPGCLEIFEFLRKRQVKIALTTGFYRKVTDIILQKLGWDTEPGGNKAKNSFIHASVSSDQVILGRPSPYMIFHAMELCRITDVRQVIKIGDTPSDLAEGKNAGCMLSLGITNGTHSRDELRDCENDGLVNDLFQFEELLAGMIE